MWTDWQGTKPDDAKANVAALQAAKLSGRPVEIVIAGVKTRVSEESNTAARLSTLIQELQEYLWQIEQNDWDWEKTIRPGFMRPGVTLSNFN